MAGKNTFQILLLNDANMILGKHHETKMEHYGQSLEMAYSYHFK